ncbi:family 43 glycosylhydrolase [Deinococcus pimensis]|uniref:family 43 glycosylhydrolase n=1 Tax=Deinococcus pimensis TaxID=309888 RepID=UPI0004B2B947|nr:family 43 glycosylhydrolase [Deinococcus pimensis]
MCASLPRRARAPLGLLALAFLASAAPGDSARPRTFRNPLLAAGQDPSVVFDGAFYHLVQSDTDGISVRTSLTLTGLGQAKRTVVWQGGRQDSPCCELWAPELVRWGDRWYVYYAADDGNNENHRMYVLEARSPRGPYTFRGKVAGADDRWAIDGTVFERAGKRYFLWSGWEGAENVQQNLYVARMRDPVTLDGPRALISQPDRPWEQVGRPHVNEGPEVLTRGGRLFVVYSASGSWTDDYCLGLLSLRGSDVLDPASWRKSNGCVFRRDDAGGVYAPGHDGLVKSPDGTEDWHLYHANELPGAGWGGRSVRAQRITWNEDGTPRFGRPAGFDEALPLPSGEFEAEQAAASGVERRDAELASGGAAVRLDAPTDRVRFTRVRAKEAGSYVVRLRAASARAARQKLDVNGRAFDVTFPAGGAGNFGTRAVTVPLRAGENVLTVSGTTGEVLLDALTVTPATR